MGYGRVHVLAGHHSRPWGVMSNCEKCERFPAVATVVVDYLGHPIRHATARVRLCPACVRRVCWVAMLDYPEDLPAPEEPSIFDDV